MSEFTARLTNHQDTCRLANALTAAASFADGRCAQRDAWSRQNAVRTFCGESLGVAAEIVTSPTYVLLQHYRGSEECIPFRFLSIEKC